VAQRIALPGAGPYCGYWATMPSPSVAPRTVTEPVSVREPSGYSVQCTAAESAGSAIIGSRRGNPQPRYHDAVQLAGSSTRELDEESASWLRRLVSTASAERQAAERELHDRLLRIALTEVRRRSASTPVTGPELDDVAHQAAGDAMLAVLAKLAEFRGESRFITWAYRFVILEVSSKLGRHYWRNPPVALDAAQWERLPDRLGLDPHQHAEAAAILTEVRHVVDTELTAHQRRIFIAIVVDGIPLTALADKLDLQRNAIYKVIFDARRKIRRALVAKGYLDEPDAGQR
jgi:RNA polymerase sigma-70 factor, ECF subfamily